MEGSRVGNEDINAETAEYLEGDELNLVNVAKQIRHGTIADKQGPGPRILPIFPNMLHFCVARQFSNHVQHFVAFCGVLRRFT